MYKAVVSTREDGVLVTTESAKTVEAAIRKAAKEAETADGQRTRIGVLENNGIGEYREIFWAWGHGVREAANEAVAMNKKSRFGGGR